MTTTELERFDPTDDTQLELLKTTVVGDQGLTNNEFALFVRVATHTHLDPFRRQIYATKRAGKLVIQTGIDGYRAIAARTGLHAGTDDAVFSGKSTDKAFPGEATVTVYKIVGGIRCPFTGTARWDEFKPDQDWMWRKMPHNQLGKCAEAQALRKAFPEETSGVEFDGDTVVDVDGVTIEPEPHEQSRDDALAARFAALPVASKVVYTAWTQAQGIAKPYDDDALDRLEHALDQVENDGPAALNGIAEDAPLHVCDHCDADAIVEVDGQWLCAEHQLPPELADNVLHSSVTDPPATLGLDGVGA